MCLKRLQRLQNKAARLVFACDCDRCSAELLNALHWLPDRERVNFKILVHTYNCLSCTAPTYLHDLVKLKNDPDTDESGPRLQSANDKTRLPDVRSHKKAGDWSFLVGEPKIWNDLPAHVREVESVSSF